MGEVVKQNQQQRQDKLAELIFSRGVANIDELIQLVDVSPMTLYRDLAALESRRVIHRSRGEVSAVATSMSETTVGFRSRQEIDEKAAVGRLAAEHLASRYSIFFDDSTTVLSAIDNLTETAQKTFISNSLTTSRKLASVDHADLITIGGRYRHQLDSFFGPMAMRELETLTPSVTVVGTAAIKNNVLYHPYSEVAAFKNRAVQRAEYAILLATASKFTRTSLYKMAEVSYFDMVIVDWLVPQEIIDQMSTQTRVEVARI